MVDSNVLSAAIPREVTGFYASSWAASKTLTNDDLLSVDFNLLSVLNQLLKKYKFSYRWF